MSGHPVNIALSLFQVKIQLNFSEQNLNLAMNTFYMSLIFYAILFFLFWIGCHSLQTILSTLTLIICGALFGTLKLTEKN